MAREIWCDGEKVGENASTIAPEVDDELELSVDGSVEICRVKRVYKFFPENGGKPIDRIEVVFDGAPPPVVF